MKEKYPNVEMFADKWLIDEINEDLGSLPKAFENTGEEVR